MVGKYTEERLMRTTPESVWNRRNLARCFVAAVLALSVSVSTAAAQRTAKRAPGEIAVGGMTREAKAVQQVNLRAELTATMPQGALNAPIEVELTKQDRADLAAPYITRTPHQIGVVKRIAPAIRVGRGQGEKRIVKQDTADGGFVWAVAVTSPDAQAIRVHFKEFSLPPNAEMYFYSPGRVSKIPTSMSPAGLSRPTRAPTARICLSIISEIF